MKENIILKKSTEFALNIIKTYKLLIENKEYVISKQLLRSGTSIGALVTESEHAESKADFIHKLSIALKEANESRYWLYLLFESGYLNRGGMGVCNHEKDIEEIIRILAAIIKTSKLNKQMIPLQ